MLHRYAYFFALAVFVSSLPLEKRQVRVGMVPIFDGRITSEPITFTFTPSRPTERSTSYPVQIRGSHDLPTLIPMDYKEAHVQTNYHSFNERWQYTAQTPRPTPRQSTPIYGQAQYYKAMQNSLYSKTYSSTVSPYKAAWTQIGDSWHQMKNTLIASGIERDWRSLWGKLTGAVEPFMSEFGQQLGRVANIFLKQHQSRDGRGTEQANLNPFLLYQGVRSERSDINTSDNELPETSTMKS